MSRILNGWVGRFCALVLVLMAATACAGSPSEAEVKRLIEQQMGENVKVNAVTKTAYAGLYEVQAGGDIFYTDAKAQYVFFGQIFEAKSRKNLTRARIEALSKVLDGSNQIDNKYATSIQKIAEGLGTVAPIAAQAAARRASLTVQTWKLKPASLTALTSALGKFSLAKDSAVEPDWTSSVASALLSLSE